MGAISGVGAGVTEEVWMRLFLMSALARLLGGWTRAAGAPMGAVAWSANAIAAIAFGALHFSNVIVLGLPLSVVNLGVVLFLNAVLGLACGELFRRLGIEAAILAHFAAAFVGHGVLPALQRIL
jgi:membrane protease YdiL (CAAX protease family)